MRVIPPSWSLRTLLCASMLVVACDNSEPLNPDGAERGSPTRLVLSPSTATLNAIGDTLDFTVHLGGSRTALQASSISWRTGDANVLALTDLGSFISTGVGVAVVVASCGDCGADGDTAVVTVQQVVASVSIEPGGNTLAVGDTASLSAAAADSNGVLVRDRSYEWTSSDPAVVSVDEDGRIVAGAVGTSWITAATDEIEGRARIEVSERPVASVSVSPADTAFLAGDTVALTATAYDADGVAIEGAAFGWSSSDPSVATVSSDGRVAGVGDGTAEIIASARGESGTARVSVSRPAAASIELSPADTALEVGLSARLRAVGYDSDGDPIEGLEFDWSSSDPAVASVGADGTVEARAEGSVTITARADGAEGSAAVRVDPGEGGTEDPPTSGAFSAFPGAEGYGALALTTCDRSDPEVRFVTNRNNSGSGSLRDAIASSDPNRLSIIVFRTGGTITLSSEIQVNRSCLYVAGQTAPGDGVQLRRPDEQGHTLLNFPRNASGSDVVIRYLRLRSGRGEPGAGDNLSIVGGHDIVIDHLSIQWGNDENIGIHTLEGWRPIRNVTIQRSIIAEALRPHSTGLLFGGRPDGELPPISHVTLAYNLFAHNGHRNPRIAAASAISTINNIMYNWNARVGRTVYDAEVDFIGNYIRPGPWSSADRLFEHEWKEPYIDPSVYLAYNIAEPNHMDPDGDNRVLIRYNHAKDYEPLPESAFRPGPLAVPDVPVTIRSATDAYSSVLGDAGAVHRLACDGRWVDVLDRIDRDILQDVVNRTGPASDEEIDHPDDFGGYPSLDPGTPCRDTDGDGMPDEFEERFGLDPNDPADARRDPDGDGYTNIEEYVNGTAPR